MHVRALALLLMLCHALPRPLCAGEAVNPHWTGIHCTECHLSEQGRELRLGGNHVALCNRCHGVDGVSAEPHPVAVQPQGPMQSAIPAAWPLQNNTITCLTCHEPLQQMTANLPLTIINPSFVRRPFQDSKTSFCFTCHLQEQFRKKNPHLQIDGSGALVDQNCLHCHPSVPDTRNPDAAPISLNQDETRLCGSCHPGKDTDHPVRGKHLVAVPDAMRDILAGRSLTRELYLPVFNNTISCSTCHNPHPTGVIQRPEAQPGAGAAYFLRGGRGRDLCLACHAEIKADPLPGWSPSVRASVASAPPEDSVEHKPVSEQKCKACHAIDGPGDGAQEMLLLCFKTGCHETALLQNTHRHETSVLKRCTFCHNPHRSRYDNLLFGNEDSLCATCHPLLRDRKDMALVRQEHQTFLSYAAALKIPSAYECSFCHSIRHKNDMDVITTELCSQCHLYLRATLSVSMHRQVSEQPCTSCHDPHAAPYPPLLKEPREAYKSFAPAPPVDR